MYLVKLSVSLQIKYMKKILSILLLVILCSCGFEPLYQNNESPLGQVSISDEIFVDVIADREGQILRNMLRNNISKANSSARYRLKADLTIKTTDLGINIDDVATRKVLWVSVKFELLEEEKVLTSGRITNNVSYAINDNEFTTLTTRNDAIEKSLRLIADDIKLKVSAHI